MLDSTVPQEDGDPSNQDAPTDQPEAPPGFELIAEVGRGGMGVVHRARDAALGREVAIKFLQDRFAPDSNTAARFIEEAHITGQLQHPGVPAVHQVGALTDGRPFLVMKLIKGNTLEELLKQGAAIDRLAVFEAIAQTVGYAHAHGVIHRDLKPANVMVGDFGEVQLMDWGLAKVLGDPTPASERAAGDPEATTAQTRIHTPRDSDSSQTRAGSVLGTPAYMSPEQAAGEIDKVDARADVFGLGAILCVMLTGKPPFDGEDSESVRLAAVRGQTDAAFARLDDGGADPDVVALCKRCLAFDPSSRPATGDAVAVEVARLRREADERARRAERDRHAAEARAEEQAKRRRAMQWATGAVVGALLLGVVVAGIGLYRAEAARRDAVKAHRAADVKRLETEAAGKAEAKQRALAEAKEAEANAVVNFFEDRVFAAGRPKGQEGGQGVNVSLRDAILASLPTLDKAFPDQPLVEARLRQALGVTFSQLGEAERAVEQLELARALYARHAGPNHPETLKCQSNLAIADDALGRRDEALKLREETLVAQRRALGPDHPDTLKSMGSLAISLDEMGRRDEALKLREETLAAQRRVLGPDHLDTLAGMNNLSVSYVVHGRHAEALKLREQTLAARRRVLPPDHPDTLGSMINLANSLEATGRGVEALKLREEALEAQKRVLPPDHPGTLQSMSRLATNLYNLGRFDEALKLREETLAARRRVLPPDHPDTLGSINDLAISQAARGKPEEALKLFEEVLASRQRVLGSDHIDTLRSMGNLAACNEDLGRHAEALKIREEALAVDKRMLGPDHPETLRSMWGVATSLLKLDRGAEAISLIDECLAKAAGKVVHPNLVPTVMDLRLRYFQKKGDPAGCRATAAMWEGLNRSEVGALYNAACFRAVAAAVQAKAGGADAERPAREDADRAMQWLKKAVAAGYKDKAQIEKDADLEALRDRDDFKALVAGLK